MVEYSDTEKIASLISASSDIMLVGHTNPDGDSVGSLTPRQNQSTRPPSC